MSRNVVFRAIALALLLSAAVALRLSAAQAQARTMQFLVRIDNVSKTNQFTASNGTKWTLDFSRGTYVVTNTKAPLFTIGTKDRRLGLRSQSEDGDPAMLGKWLAQTYGSASGQFLTAVAATKPGGIRPGHAFEFTVSAKPGQRLYFTTMFGQSNDWFYAPGENGIALFDANGNPIGGNSTSQIKLWDAGTEADEELGIGPSQGPRQPHPRYGDPDSNPLVRLVTSDARFLEVSEVMRVTVTPR
jgi:hypothetical protein